MCRVTVTFGIMCSLALAGAAPAQCQKGGGGMGGMTGGKRGHGMPGMMTSGPGMSGMPGMMPGLIGGMPGMAGLTTVPTAARMLTSTRQQQERLNDMIATLEDASDGPGLSEAQKRKLKAAVTAASKKSDKAESTLAGIEGRQGRGLMTATDETRLTALSQQQQALLQSLEPYRQNVGEILRRQNLKANQAR